MAQRDFLPRNDLGKDALFTQFAAHIGTYAADFGPAAAQTDSQAADAACRPAA